MDQTHTALETNIEHEQGAPNKHNSRSALQYGKCGGGMSGEMSSAYYNSPTWTLLKAFQPLKKRAKWLKAGTHAKSKSRKPKRHALEPSPETNLQHLHPPTPWP